MNFLRQSALASLYSLFTVTLLGFGLFFSLKIIVGGPQHIEQALTRSGIYTVITRQVIDENKDNSSASLPLDQTAVQSAVEKAFPPQLLQQTVNTVLDGVYAWLQGKSTTPSFRVDLTGAKSNLANYIASYVQQRLDTLPACTVANMPANLNTINPYTVTCLPPGFDKAAAVQQAKQAALDNTDVIDNPLITADTLKNSNGQTLAEQLKAIPRVYHYLIVSVYVTGLLALLSGAGIVLLSVSRRRGLRRISFTAITVGALSAMLAILSAYVLGRASQSIGSDTKAKLIEDKLTETIHLLANDMRTWWAGYGVLLMALGIGTLVGLRFLAQQRRVAPHQEDPGEHLPTGGFVKNREEQSRATKKPLA